MSPLAIVVVFSVAFGAAFTSACPTFWTSYGSHCYRLYGTPQTWHHAEGRCQRSYSGKTPHLVSIHSYGENAFIKQLIETAIGGSGEYSYWIGLSELHWPGLYSWSDNSVNNYQSWRQGEPNNAGGKPEHCVEFWKISNRVGWNDKICSTNRRYICKMQK